MSKKLDSSNLEVVDDLTAPTILIEGITGAIGSNGVVTIGCTQSVLQVSSEKNMQPKLKMVLRLAIPAGAVPSIATFFKDQVDRMVTDGSIVPEQNQQND